VAARIAISLRHLLRCCIPGQTTGELYRKRRFFPEAIGLVVPDPVEILILEDEIKLP
jgi:hypothetical protein